MKVRPSGSRTEEVLKSGGIIDGKNDGMPPDEVEESLRLTEDLKFFLATAPVNWQENQIIRRYYLNSDQGFVSCVFWNSLYYITGTDIVKCCMYRMQKFGREIIQKKKFEEGIFSDLRNLKCGIDATLEQSKSEFLSFLFRNMCLKTQKKQKVFFWFSVPHDKLFADALERDLKRESMGQPSTTNPTAEPAKSFEFDSLSSKPLYDQLLKHSEAMRVHCESSVSSSSNVISNTTDVNNIDSSEPLGASGGTNTTAPSVDTEQSLERTASTSMQLTADIMNDANDSSFTPQVKVEQELYSSRNAPTNFVSQKLVVEPNSLDLNTSAKSSEIFKDNMAVIDDCDRGDFPLDYFPVEIEYPNPEEEADAMMGVQPGASFFPPSMLYDGPGGDELIPPMSNVARFPPYSAHTPYPMPLSGTRPQFMTNGKYYASVSAMKEKFEPSNGMPKEVNSMKVVDSENPSEALEPHLTDDPEVQQQEHSQSQHQQRYQQQNQQQNQQRHQHNQHQHNQHQHQHYQQQYHQRHPQQQQQQQQQQYPHQYLNPYQKYYGGLYPGYYQPPAVNGTLDMTNFVGEMGTYGYDELFSSQEGYDPAYFLPQEPFNWGFFPQQPIQCPPSASTYMAKPFTPSYRSTPVSARNPYLQIAQNQWGTQSLTSPYGSKVTSATSKSFPPGSYYSQQSSASFARRKPPFQGNQTISSKNYVTKQNGKITKPVHRKVNQQQNRNTGDSVSTHLGGGNNNGNNNASYNSNSNNDNDNNDYNNNKNNNINTSNNDNNNDRNNEDTDGNNRKTDSIPGAIYRNSEECYEEDFESQRAGFSIPTPDSNNAQRIHVLERGERDNDNDSKFGQ